MSNANSQSVEMRVTYGLLIDYSIHASNQKWRSKQVQRKKAGNK